MAAAPLKIRTTFNLQCYTHEGVEAIKAALLDGKRETSDEKFKIIFQLIAPPEYKAEVVTLDKNGGIERLNKALTIIQASIKAKGGLYKLVTAPTRIGSRVDDVDNEEVIANMNKIIDENSSDEENEGEGIDCDLDNDDVQMEDDDEN
jgi:translation initiation factor 2 subunit 1